LAAPFHNSDSIAPDYMADKSKIGLCLPQVE